jgi:hypothetical protein
MRSARRVWFNPAATSIGLSGLTSHELSHTAASLVSQPAATSKPSNAYSDTPPPQ